MDGTSPNLATAQIAQKPTWADSLAASGVRLGNESLDLVGNFLNPPRIKAANIIVARREQRLAFYKADRKIILLLALPILPVFLFVQTAKMLPKN